MKLAILSSALLLSSANAFVPSASTQQTSRLYSMVPSDENPFDKFIDNVKMRARIAQESNKAGASPKQTIADVLAGEFDEASVEAKIEEAIASAPCVMFTWESSPSCKKAVEAFKTMNANVKILRLDDPWSEGNPMRAVLGKKVGRTSVPFVFIDGEYIGGFDGGINDKACGMVDLAFKGELRDMLEKAGAMKDSAKKVEAPAKVEAVEEAESTDDASE